MLGGLAFSASGSAKRGSPGDGELASTVTVSETENGSPTSTSRGSALALTEG
jgi:hypothetical protein